MSTFSSLLSLSHDLLLLQRVVVDASRHLNPFLLKRRVKLQDLSDVNDVLSPGMFFATEDLDSGKHSRLSLFFPYTMSHNSGYWQLSMHPEHRKYLGISVIDPETKETLYFEWNVMFLGISDAVFIFVSIHS